MRDIVSCVDITKISNITHFQRRRDYVRANQEIRNKVESNRILCWEVADKVGIAQSNLSVWLRTEMRDDRKLCVEKAIDELLAERKEG